MTKCRLDVPLRILTLLGFLHVPGFSEDRILSSIVERAEQDSQVMEHAFFLSDVYGPRFLGSPRKFVEFLLPAHITALAVSMLLYANQRF